MARRSSRSTRRPGRLTALELLYARRFTDAERAHLLKVLEAPPAPPRPAPPADAQLEIPREAYSAQPGVTPTASE